MRIKSISSANFVPNYDIFLTRFRGVGQIICPGTTEMTPHYVQLVGQLCAPVEKGESVPQIYVYKIPWDPRVRRVPVHRPH